MVCGYGWEKTKRIKVDPSSRIIWYGKVGYIYMLHYETSILVGKIMVSYLK